jgi:hypothetical protein
MTSLMLRVSLVPDLLHTGIIISRDKVGARALLVRAAYIKCSDNQWGQMYNNQRRQMYAWVVNTFDIGGFN